MAIYRFLYQVFIAAAVAAFEHVPCFLMVFNDNDVYVKLHQGEEPNLRDWDRPEVRV